MDKLFDDEKISRPSVADAWLPGDAAGEPAGGHDAAAQSSLPAPPGLFGRSGFLESLESNQCRWPLWESFAKVDSDQMLFCAQPSAIDCPYCPAHLKVAYLPRRLRPLEPPRHKSAGGLTKLDLQLAAMRS